MRTTQLRLTKQRKPIFGTTYGKPQYNKVIGKIQRIETHRGCHWAKLHDYCYEPQEMTDFPIPEITQNQVQILDMNFLCRKNVLRTIRDLRLIRVKKKVVYYEAVCGFDYRLLNQDIAKELKLSRFIKPRLAWDGCFSEQMKIKDAIGMFLKVGYKAKEIMLFMIVNWKIPKTECERKLNLMKVWNVKVCDCCYDGGYKHCTPEFWTGKELTEFRAKCRKHNQLVNFGIDPEVTNLD